MHELFSACKYCQHEDVCQDICKLAEEADKKPLDKKKRCKYLKIKQRLDAQHFNCHVADMPCALSSTTAGPHFYRQMLQEIVSDAGRSRA